MRDNDSPASRGPHRETMTQRAFLLDRATRLTMGDRNEAYGDPYSNHAQIAGLWNAYFITRMEHNPEYIIDAEDVATCMVLLKIARAAQRSAVPDTLNEDTFVDMIAYAAIAGECRENYVARELLDAEKAQGI